MTTITIYPPGANEDPRVIIGPRGERWYLGPYANDTLATAASTALPSGIQNGYVYLNTTTGKTRVRVAGAWANNDADAQDAVTAAQLAETNAETAQAAAEAARDAALAGANFRSTIAEGITDFAVGEYFTSTDDGALTANTGQIRMYKRIAGSPYYQDEGDDAAPVGLSLLGHTPIVGAVGDGVTVDSAALARAVTTAGVGGVIRLSPGKTYLVDRELTLLAGQTLLGNGATIKRCAQIITSTTSVITNGSTYSFTVATGTGANFSIGQEIAMFNGANYTTSNLTIASIVGDAITTTTAAPLSAGSPWSGTTVVALSFDTINPGNGKVCGLAIDGNKSNWSYYHWEITSEIHPRLTAGQSYAIEDCTINNAPGEGIQENGPVGFANASLHNQIKNNTITNINGNGIHLSSSNGAQVTGNFIYNTNLQGAAMGHNGGCIALSNCVYDALIANNHLDTGRAGVGQVDSSDNSYVTIVGNTVRNMTVYMLEIRGYNAAVTDVVITGNRFYNTTIPAAAALISVGLGDTNTNDFQRITVTGNEFYNAGLELDRITGLTVSGNTFGMDYQATDTYHNAIRCSNLVDATISGNSTRYGNSGIISIAANINTTISNNTIYQPYYYGIYDSGGTNILIAGNNIQMDNNVNGSAQGISLSGAGATARGNMVKMTAGYAGIRINGVANCVVQANTVRCSAVGKTIRIDSGSTGYVVSENQVNYAVTDTPAVGVRVANNDIIV